MPDELIPLTALTAPPRLCFPTTVQGLLGYLAQYLAVQLPTGYTQIIVSQTTPDPEDNDKIWLKVDGSGNPIGFLLFSGGVWTPIAPGNVFIATDTGTANALSIVVPNYPHAALVPGVFVVKANADQTGAATLTVNGFAAVPIKIEGADPHEFAIIQGKWYALVFHGGTFEILNPDPEDPDLPVSKEFYSGELPIGTAGTLGVPIPHGLGGEPKIIHARLKCIATNLGVPAGTSIPIENFHNHWVDNDQDRIWQSIQVHADILNITVGWAFADGQGNEIHFKETGNSSNPSVIDPSKWVLQVWAFA